VRESWTSYSYDRLSWLTGVQQAEGTATSYQYDPVGNRTQQRRRGGQGTTHFTTTYQYDAADRLLDLTTAGAFVDYSVDGDGRTTARDGDTFAYDRAHRLTSATVSGTTTWYTYDGDGKRACAATGATGGTACAPTGGTAQKYLYDAAGGLPVLLQDEQRKYVWGPTGLLYHVEGTGNGTATYSHADALGSIRALTDQSGAVVQTYRSDEFGVQVQAVGTSGQPFGFAGEQRDGDSAT
jgi:YD repeat-containing protein